MIRQRKDSSLYGLDNSGSLQNGASVIYDSDRSGYVLSLDGTNDYVAIANSTDINLGTHPDRTISASFKATSVTTRQVIFEEGGTNAGYSLYIQSGQLYVGAWTGNSAAASVFLSTAIDADQWYGVKLVNDGGQLTAYLDDVSFGSATTAAVPEHTNPLAIGRTSGGTKTHTGNISTGSNFGGQIDDVRIYNVPQVGNTAPVSSDDSYTTTNDRQAIITVLANDSDSESDGLVVTDATQASNGSVAVNENGTITYTPNAGYFGDDSFTYDISDNQGASSTATVSVNVLSTGLIARYTFDDLTASDVSTLGRINNGNLVNGATVVNDPQRGNVLSLDGINDYVALPQSDDINLTDNPDRTIFLSFKADSTTDRQVLFEEGGAGRGLNIYLDSGKLYAGMWGLTGVEDAFLSRVVSAEQWNHVSIQVNQEPGIFSATLNGHVIGTAEAGLLGEHGSNTGIGGVNFRTRFHDGNFTGNTGAEFSGLIDNVRLYNASVENTVPGPVSDDVSTDQGTPIVVDVLGNDLDVDGDVLVVSEVTDGSNGIVTLVNGEVTYIPDPNFSGADSFTYSVFDGFGGTSIATVNVTVNSVNEAPTAITLSNNSVAENSDTSTGLTVGTLIATDADSTAFTYSLAAGPGDGDNGSL